MAQVREDRRREERISVELRARLGATAAVTRDVSASGMFLETDAFFAFAGTLHTTEKFEMTVGNMVRKGHGRIVRIEPRGRSAGVAVRIIESVLEQTNV